MGFLSGIWEDIVDFFDGDEDQDDKDKKGSGDADSGSGNSNTGSTPGKTSGGGSGGLAFVGPLQPGQPHESANSPEEQNIPEETDNEGLPDIKRISLEGSSMFVDGSKVLYDREKGWLPGEPIKIGVSPTLIGLGFKFDLDKGLTGDHPKYPEGGLRFTAGLPKLGLEFDPDLSRPSIKIGYGLGSPIGPSSNINTFTGFLNDSAVNFNKYTAGASGFLNDAAKRFATK